MPATGRAGATRTGSLGPHHQEVMRCHSVMLTVLLVLRYVKAQTETQLINALVRKWAPVIWLAPGEKFFPLSVEEFLERVSVLRGRDPKFLYPKERLEQPINKDLYLYGKDPSQNRVPVYATVTTCAPSNITSLHFHVTFWTFYPYNSGKEACLIRNVPIPPFFDACYGERRTFGNHVGDFERISMSFRGRQYPDEIFLATHNSGAYYKYDPQAETFHYKPRQTGLKGVLERPKFPKTVRTINGHPSVFSARGSHGSWGEPGVHQYVKLLGIRDECGYGLSWKTWLKVKVYHLGYSRLPEWMAYGGRWGNSRSGCFIEALGLCEYSEGPPGILHRKGDFFCAPKYPFQL